VARCGVFDLQRKAGVALWVHDGRQEPVRGPVTASFVYVPRHGTSGRYQGAYPEPAPRADARRLAELLGLKL
jgi:uncharacterized protein YecE (DUF72 family)